MLLIPVVVALLAIGSLCEPGEDVTIVNQSSEAVVVYEDEAVGPTIQPQTTEIFNVMPFSGTLTYSVRSGETQEVRASRTFTYDEISREHGITLVVDSN